MVDFHRWLDAEETPFTTLLTKGRGWTVPDFCAKTKKEAVEPYMTWYGELIETLVDVAPDQDEEDWGDWQPSVHHIRLSKLANEIGQYVYKEVDNPAYDEDACLSWKKENMMSWTKVEWGPSDANIGTPQVSSDESSDMGG